MGDGAIRAAFVKAACVPRDDSHVSGTLDEAQAILDANPEIAGSDVHTAAILGDDIGVRRFLDLDRALATATSEPYGWDALTHLCFSRYLRLDPARSAGFVRAAEALLDAGANANTGFFEDTHQPNPVRESALYGAAGIAHDPELTRVLLTHGADPNDDEVPYHSPETYDNRALTLLVDSGRLTADSLATMLLRKADWHDYDGLELLLKRGVDPNRITRWGRTALHQAVMRDNSIDHINLLLDHRADATLAAEGQTTVALAARRGRGDILESLTRRGIAVELYGPDLLAAACARNDTAAVRAIAGREPLTVAALIDRGGELLAEFAGVGNTDGLRQLLDLGIPADAPYAKGDPYYGVPRNSTALQVAAWRGRHETVKLLIDRGADVNAVDANGRTPLTLAVRACVDSYWSDCRSPDSVRALLAAGASAAGVVVPCGYGAVDDLLRERRS